MMDRFLKGLEAGVARVNQVFVLIGSLFLIGTMVTTNLDLFMRFVFHAPIMGMNEITELFLLYLTFLGTAWVYHDDAHVVVDVLLYNLVEGRRKNVLILQNHIIVGIISLVLVYYGTATTIDYIVRDVRNPTILETPIAIAIGIIPIGAFVLLLEVLIKSLRILRGREG